MYKYININSAFVVVVVACGYGDKLRWQIDCFMWQLHYANRLTDRPTCNYAIVFSKGKELEFLEIKFEIIIKVS